MGEYYDIYLKTDVLLLADVFENFRKPCLKDYGLDPCWYLTAPAFAWDSMLKLTGIELQLLTDLDMHLFFKRQIRGGVSTAFHRFAKANNKYMKNFECIMYNFHYGYAKKKWEKIKVLYTDTDSLIYEIETEDIFADTAEDVKKWFDTSGYSKDHPAVGIGFPIGKNKNVPGVFKDECGGSMISEFAGLRAKCYSVLMDERKNSKRCKGVKKNVVKKEIMHEDFKATLFSGVRQIRNQNLIKSKGHNVFTEKMKKIALSADDDKRIVLDDGVSTLAIGHWRLELFPDLIC